MATGYRNSSGQDLDTLFQAGTVTVAGFRLADGSPVQFAARGAAAKIADVGFRDSSGLDVSNTWLGISSAPPVNDGSLPAILNAVDTTSGPGSVSATATFTYLASGATSWSASGGVSGSGTWLASGASADFDIRLTALGSTLGLTGATGTWLQLNADRTVSLTATLPADFTPNILSYGTTVRIEIRRRSDSVVLVDRNVSLEATAERI